MILQRAPWGTEADREVCLTFPLARISRTRSTATGCGQPGFDRLNLRSTPDDRDDPVSLFGGKVLMHENAGPLF